MWLGWWWWRSWSWSWCNFPKIRHCAHVCLSKTCVVSQSVGFVLCGSVFKVHNLGVYIVAHCCSMNLFWKLVLISYILADFDHIYMHYWKHLAMSSQEPWPLHFHFLSKCVKRQYWHQKLVLLTRRFPLSILYFLAVNKSICLTKIAWSHD